MEWYLWYLCGLLVVVCTRVVTDTDSSRMRPDKLRTARGIKARGYKKTCVIPESPRIYESPRNRAYEGACSQGTRGGLSTKGEGKKGRNCRAKGF
jgi:hypothetical protein